MDDSLRSKFVETATALGDLAVIALLTGLSALAVGLGAPYTEPLGVLLLFVFPGYAVVAAVFPAAPVSSTARSGSLLRLSHRIVYSLAMGLLLAGLVGVGLHFFLTITQRTVLLAVTLLTASALITAGKSRHSAARTPVDECLELAEARYVTAGDRWWSLAGTGVLVVLVLVAGVTVATAIPATGTGEEFTELYLLSADDGETRSASDYPTEWTAGESRSVVVGITNNERHTERYTVVVALQRVTSDGATTVRRFDPISATLADGESREMSRDLRIETTGTDLRLAFLLYRGSPPRTPTLDNSYREIHLWITVN